ncbi:MAG: hypothetical protein JO180_08965 [Gemmatirosa sp.]|nr:hypothetical protein [Gemmatirosa sp.]
MLLAGLLPHPAVRDVAGAPGVGASGARLALPAAYVALSPLTRVLDALSLLSPPQHAALAASVLLVAVAWGRRRLGAMAARFGVALGALAATYLAAALLPRPAASLAVDDPSLVRVDFHTHTAASHDVPRWFDAGRRRAWERAAGFDLAFISDHRSFDGAAAARPANPRIAGDGIVLAPALEGWFGGVHVVLLGVAESDRVLLGDSRLDELLPAALASHQLAAPPVAIATIPDRVLPTLTAAARDGAPFLRAVEIADGAPRALAQADRERAAIGGRAHALGLVPIASSNHHGWGRTAEAWTLVRVPGWRALPADVLAARVVDVLRRGDGAAVRVVERERPTAGGVGPARGARLAATVPMLAWQTVAALEPVERGVWLLWIWALVLAPVGVRGVRVRRRVRGLVVVR